MFKLKSTPHIKKIDPGREMKASSIQYCYRNGGIRARVFTKTLAQGNSKNNGKNRNRSRKQKRVKMEIKEVSKAYSSGQQSLQKQGVNKITSLTLHV